MPRSSGFFSDLPRRPSVRLLSLFLVTQVLACYSQRPWRVSPPELTDPVTFDYLGTSVTLHSPYFVGDSILGGWERGAQVVQVVSAEGIRT